MGTFHIPWFLQSLSQPGLGDFQGWDIHHLGQRPCAAHLVLQALLGPWRDGMHILGIFGAQCPHGCPSAAPAHSPSLEERVSQEERVDGWMQASLGGVCFRKDELIKIISLRDLEVCFLMPESSVE